MSKYSGIAALNVEDPLTHSCTNTSITTYADDLGRFFLFGDEDMFSLSAGVSSPGEAGRFFVLVGWSILAILKELFKFNDRKKIPRTI